MTSIVSLREATKEYLLGDVRVRALRGVSLDVHQGEFLSVAGPSGSGKTTLLNLAGCVDTPTSGSVVVAGRDITRLSDRELTLLRLHTIGFIFQSFNLVGALDVFRNVELPLLLQRSTTVAERRRRVLDLVGRVGLLDFLRHRPSELSGGQRQRVAIARALISRPKLVLADEPTANLDSETGQSILDLMKELNRTEQTTFIFSTHDARVMDQATRVVRIADGLLSADSARTEAFVGVQDGRSELGPTGDVSTDFFRGVTKAMSNKAISNRLAALIAAIGIGSSAVLAVTMVFGNTTENHRSGSSGELVNILKGIDARGKSLGDYRAEVYLEQREKGKVAVAYDALVYRREEGQAFVILFTNPKASQGQGYLRIDKNLWFYDPAVGRWERRTERERIGGTNSRRSDFDESRFAEEYDPEDSGREKLGAYSARKLTLRGKAGMDLAFSVVKLWVDEQTQNVLKRQDFAVSGKLLRTTYYPKWKKVYSESKRGDVWFQEEIRMYDEVEKENSTLILVKSADVRPLEPNLFTKAWLEGKSR